MKKFEFQTYCGERNLNEEQRLIILETKNFPGGLQINRYVEFSQKDWQEMMEIISHKMRNLEFQIFFESMSSDGYHRSLSYFEKNLNQTISWYALKHIPFRNLERGTEESATHFHSLGNGRKL